MGRIATKEIKRISSEMLTSYPNEFKIDFESNKAIVGKFLKEKNITSKKIRNCVAGLITRIVKKQRR